MSSECQHAMISEWRTRLQTRNLEGPKSVVVDKTLASMANHLVHTGISKAPPVTID